jgi:hypothetical protein
MVGIRFCQYFKCLGVPVATVALNGAKMPEFLPHKSLEVTTMRFRQNHFFIKEGLKQAVDKAASGLKNNYLYKKKTMNIQTSKLS